MFFVGNARIGNYDLWVTTKSPFDRSFRLTDEYYNVFITKLVSYPSPTYGSFVLPYYVNPSTCDLFPYFEMRFPPKEVTKGKEETSEEVMYREHWQAYVNRKDMQMPMWLMHRSILQQVIDTLTKESNENS